MYCCSLTVRSWNLIAKSIWACREFTQLGPRGCTRGCVWRLAPDFSPEITPPNLQHPRSLVRSLMYHGYDADMLPASIDPKANCPLGASNRPCISLPRSSTRGRLALRLEPHSGGASFDYICIYQKPCLSRGLIMSLSLSMVYHLSQSYPPSFCYLSLHILI